jgi:co-chaperonin GroES (HSP10)
MNVIHENVLVLVGKTDEVQNGIFVPTEARLQERQGVIVKFGEEVPARVQDLLRDKPTITYKEYYDGAALTVEGESYIVMNFKDILIIL